MTAFAVRKHVSRKLKEPTIRTVLRRLEEKGYVTHSVVSGTFIYRATDTAEAAAASAVQGIVEGYCGGSLERVLRGLIDAGFVERLAWRLLSANSNASRTQLKATRATPYGGPGAEARNGRAGRHGSKYPTREVVADTLADRPQGGDRSGGRHTSNSLVVGFFLDQESERCSCQLRKSP